MDWIGPAPALCELEKVKPLHSTKISPLEEAVQLEADVLRGKIQHFTGKFSDAKKLLERVVGMIHHPERSAPSRAIAHLSAVCCELGEYEQGIRYAESHLSPGEYSPNSMNERRLRLALASAYLVKAMWIVRSVLPSDVPPNNAHDVLHKAQEILEGLNAYNPAKLSRADKINRVSICLGLAIIAHLQRKFVTALQWYESVLSASSECGWASGYVEAMTLSSMSVILHTTKDVSQAEKYERQALSIYQERSFYFVGFGTLWPEIVGRWLKRLGRGTIVMSDT
ncbi:hypothetical protein LTR62_001657 [Meristemomyces frigidus]|uniref:Uncharacterized protein n=1 Tax=Meristemomyces frigidus TaxID=1508187 RepID=A0AAN7TJM2_9PEZI|nr:hypothetical protein LTR62_001657 [Meristemomyces frigidus]